MGSKFEYYKQIQKLEEDIIKFEELLKLEKIIDMFLSDSIRYVKENNVEGLSELEVFLKSVRRNINKNIRDLDENKRCLNECELAKDESSNETKDDSIELPTELQLLLDEVIKCIDKYSSEYDEHLKTQKFISAIEKYISILAKQKMKFSSENSKRILDELLTNLNEMLTTKQAELEVLTKQLNESFRNCAIVNDFVYEQQKFLESKSDKKQKGD